MLDRTGELRLLRLIRGLIAWACHATGAWASLRARATAWARRLAPSCLALIAGVALLVAPSQSAGQCDRSAKVLLVLDKSSSMRNKLATAREAIAALLRAADPAIDFGLLVFDAGQCNGSGRLVVPVAPDARDAIIAEIGRTRASGGTSIEGAIREASAALGPLEGQRAIVLITDGEDSCHRAAQAAAQALQAGIETFVVGYGTGVDGQQLLAIAQAGRGPGAAVYQADRQDDLEDVLLALGRELPAGGELCNGVDDDCDGAVDESPEGAGLPCDTGWPGACSLGVRVCADGVLDCSDRVPATTEVCDGVDNDCDGPIDEDVDLSGSCATGAPGICGVGELSCVAGAVACVALENALDEACDAVDNDCDGRIDEGLRNGCGACGGAVPEACDAVDNDCDGRADEDPACAEPCQSGECTGDGICDAASELCVPRCEVLGCEDPMEICTAGRCQPRCGGGCDDGFVCRADVDRCVPESRADCAVACASDSCRPGDVCVESCDRLECRPSCADIACPADEACLGGLCVAKPCVECPEGQVCGGDGQCHPDPCLGVVCDSPFICLEGFCGLDPCTGHHCPTGQRCTTAAGRATCIYSTAPSPPADGGATGEARDAGAPWFEQGAEPTDAGAAPAEVVGCEAAAGGYGLRLRWLPVLGLWVLLIARRRSPRR